MTPNDWAKDWDSEERSALEPFEEEVSALRKRHANDPPLNVLRAAAGEVLPEDLQASTSAHLAGSRWSRALVESANDSDGGLSADDETRLLDRIRRQGKVGGESRIQWRAWWPILAAASVATIALMVMWPPAQSPARRAANDPLATASPKPAPAVPTFALSIDKPAVKLSPRAFTYRGEVGGGDFISQLKPALDAYRQDDYQKANDEFSALTKKYPQAVEIGFYQGIARLFLSDFSGADASFAKADQLDRDGDTSFASDIAWYRAIADERLGRIVEARARLTALCSQVGQPRQAAACDAVGRLR